MKKTFLFTLLCMLIGFTQINADEVTIGGIKYNVNNGEAQVLKDASYAGDIVIPKTITVEGVGQVPVTSIQAEAFKENQNITSLVIEAELTALPDRICQKSKSITNVVLPNTIKTIGDNAFQECKGITSINIPTSLESLKGDGHFADWGEKNITLDFPASFDNHFSWIFNNTKIDKVIIRAPKYPSVNGAHPFHAVKNDNWEFTPEAKPYFALADWWWDKKYYTSIEDDENFYSVVKNADVVNGIKYKFYKANDGSAYKAKVLKDNYSGDVVIPATVEYDSNTYTVFDMEKMEGLENVTSFDIKANLFFIYDHGFKNCTKLQKVTLPNSCIGIDGWTFEGCTNLTTVNIPTSYFKKSKDGHMFKGCTNLSSVMDYPATTQSIGGWDYEGCSSLDVLIVRAVNKPDISNANIHNFKHIYVPDESVEDYKTGDWWHDGNIKDKIEGLSNYGTTEIVATIGGLNYSLKNGSAKLLKGDYSGELVIPASVEYEGKTYNVNAIEALGDGNAANANQNITSVKIEAELTAIPGYAFANCKKIESIELPNTITSFPTHAFQYCEAMTTINIPTSIQTLADAVFEHCKNLSCTLEFPSSTTNLGDWTFNDCGSLTTLIINAVNPPSTTGATKLDNFQEIYVPVVTYSSYLTAANYPASKIKPNGEKAELKYTFNEDGTATVEHLGDVNPEPHKGTNPYSGDIVIPDTVEHDGAKYAVTKIGFRAFKNSYITSVEVPNTVTFIDDGAFAEIENKTLKSIKIGTSVHAGGVTTIKGGFANECGDDVDIYFYGLTAPTEVGGYFGSNKMRVHVPSTRVDEYKAIIPANVIGDIEVPYGYAELQEDIVKYETKYNELSAFTFVPGYPTTESLSALKTKIDLAKKVATTASSTICKSSYTLMQQAEAAFVYTPVTEGYYKIVSAGKDYDNQYAMYNANGVVNWKPYDENLTEFVYQFTAAGGRWNVQNLIDGSYIKYGDSYGSYGCDVKTTATPEVSQEFIQTSLGKFAMRGGQFAYTAVTNHGGPGSKTSGKLTIWGTPEEAQSNGQNVWKLVPVSEEELTKNIESALDALVAEYSATIGTAPGLYSATTATDFYAAIETAKTNVKEGDLATKLQVIDTFKGAYDTFTSTATINPITEGYYAIVTAGNGGKDVSYSIENKFAMYNADGYVQWKEYNPESEEFTYYLSPASDGKWNVKSVADNSYIKRGESSYSCKVATTETAENAQDFIASNFIGKFIIKGSTYIYAVHEHNGPQDKTSGYLNVYGTVDEGNKFGMNVWKLVPIAQQPDIEIDEKGNAVITGTVTVKDLATIENVTSVDLTGATLVGVTAEDLAFGDNVLAIVAPESGITGKNIINNGVCEELVLTDGVSFTSPVQFTATNATLQKNVEDGWYTLILPYASEVPANAKAYTFEKAEGNSLVFVSVEGTIPANTPVLIKSATGTDENISFGGSGEVSFEGATGDFMGTLTTIPAGQATGKYILNETGTAFGIATETATIPAFRCYYYVNSGSSVGIIDNPTDDDARASQFSITILDKTTGTKSVIGAKKAAKIFNVSGTVGEGFGVNTKDGKKYIK